MQYYHSITTKKGRQEYIAGKVSSNGPWAIRALNCIFGLQTDMERSDGTTHEHNNIGFSDFDAEILSSFAKQIQSGKELTENQMAVVFKRMPKYRRQLQEIADFNISKKTA